MKRQHPIAVMRYVSKNFWLLLIPLVRGLLALKFDFYNWLSGAYLDILIVLAIFGMAFFRWWNINFETTESGINISTGLFVRETMQIPFSSVSSFTLKKTFLMRPLRAVTLFVDTDSSSTVNKPEDPDLKLIIREKDVQKLLKFIDESKLDSGENGLHYKPNKRRMLFFSLAFSSALSGLIYFGTFLIQGGRLVGNELEQRFLGAVSNVTRIAEKVIYGITPVTVGIIIIIGMGWLYSFMSNYLRHINFEISKSLNGVQIRSGFFSRWSCFINSDKINYVDLRQNLLMKIFRVMSVNISCSGYGKQKNEIPVFVPVTGKKNVAEVIESFLPEFSPEEGERFDVRAGYVMRFLGPPTVLIFAIILVFAGTVLLFPEWYSVTLFAAVMGEIVAVHLLTVNLAAFLSNSIEVCGKSIVVRYCKAFGFHNVIAPIDKISEIRISQNFLQKFNGSCKFVLYTRGERAVKHTVIGMQLCDAEKAAELLGHSAA